MISLIAGSESDAEAYNTAVMGIAQNFLNGECRKQLLVCHVVADEGLVVCHSIEPQANAGVGK
ncbi:hypothetical protein ACIPUB_20065 [Paeniglutamicibacter sp. ORCA_105]|uniref:hypothetical protein n=1 Tax=Paeniglutamicibacter sp. ORCA_105 TaxID=3377336 RepID=UPI003894865F